METKFTKSFRAARRSGVSLIAVETPDPEATMNLINSVIPTEPTAKTGPAPQFTWDCVNGLVPRNELAEAYRKQKPFEPMSLAMPQKMLAYIQVLPEKSVVYMLNADMFFADKQTVQAIWNLRDSFKSNKRTLVMLGVSFTLPQQIVKDVLLLDEPYPTADELRAVVNEALGNYGVKADSEAVDKAVDAIVGLAMFPAEQVVNMSITPEGIDQDMLWERKRKMIEQARGTSVYRGTENFDMVVGCEQTVAFCKKLARSKKRRTKCIVLLDEVEKHLANVNATGTGDTTKEMLGPVLSEMQDRKYRGFVLYGVPGAGKTLLFKAFCNEANAPGVIFDFSGMKGSKVGESGAAVREALKMIYAISQGDAIFIATSNDLSVLPGELLRRFKLGIFFYDYPTEAAKAETWKVYKKLYKLTDKKNPDDTGWTQAEIAQCCELASDLECSLLEAAAYVVPVSKSKGDVMEQMRRDAHGRYLSASYPGLYQYETNKNVAVGRSASLED